MLYWVKNLAQLCFLTLSAGVQELESRFLVPGDLLILMGSKVHMPCDAILIDGSCVVNEGMLTGTVLWPHVQPLLALPGFSWVIMAEHAAAMGPSYSQISLIVLHWTDLRVHIKADFYLLGLITCLTFWVFSISFLQKRLLQSCHFKGFKKFKDHLMFQNHLWLLCLVFFYKMHLQINTDGLKTVNDILKHPSCPRSSSSSF